MSLILPVKIYNLRELDVLRGKELLEFLRAGNTAQNGRSGSYGR